MKKSLLIASLLLASSSVMANDFFVGANIASANSTIKGTLGLTSGSATVDGTTYSAGDSISVSDSDRDANINFKFGIINTEGRYYVKTGDIYDVDGISYKSTTLNYDKFVGSTINGFKPYVGAHIGKGKLDILGYNNTGTEYGIQVGALKQIDNNLAFELGLRHSRSNAKLTDSTAATTESGTLGSSSYSLTNAILEASVEAEKMTSLYLGLNYKF